MKFSKKEEQYIQQRLQKINEGKIKYTLVNILVKLVVALKKEGKGTKAKWWLPFQASSGIREFGET